MQCNVESRSNFYIPSWVFMNMNYWIDEFIDAVDSDLILMIQGDSFLCHYLDPDNWRDVTFVGGIGPNGEVRHGNSIYGSHNNKCLQAPLPMAFEASLLSAEMLFPEEVTLFYGELLRDEKETYVQ
eukprot:2840374-Ditylum_brightwellii.AAC.1